MNAHWSHGATESEISRRCVHIDTADNSKRAFNRQATTNSGKAAAASNSSKLGPQAAQGVPEGLGPDHGNIRTCGLYCT